MADAERDTPPPGRLLEEMMKARGWTQMDLAAILGKPQRTISEIITGKSSITPKTAQSLAQAFNNDPAFWMDLESRHRLALVKTEDESVRERAKLFEIAPVKDMQKRGWIRETHSPEELAEELKRFFGVDALSETPISLLIRRRHCVIFP